MRARPDLHAVAARSSLAALLLASCAARPPARDLAEFEARLEKIRAGHRIPAFSAAIGLEDRIVWAKGFGFADLEKRIPAAPDTAYHLASLTKTFASTLLLQLVEEGKLDLEDPVAKYGVEIPSPGTVRVKHLFTHTSRGNPGERYAYDGGRFRRLDQVLQSASGGTFAGLLGERIIRPLGLERTGPNVRDPEALRRAGIDGAALEARLAKPYALRRWGRVVPSEYPVTFSVSAGLISTAPEMARYSLAIDADRFLRPETKERAFTPAISTNGQTLPYGLGWFVQEVGGRKLVWHYGYWQANSSLIIKEPARKLTFVILANTDMLSQPYRLGDGDLLRSPVAREFVGAFVEGPGSPERFFAARSAGS